ncbi:hypothetical protein [Gilvimarinus polysaccharolyticus]|uniref:hypothetical protein n=1 Tax=Gilvimarinus polysaccharolyticus TaxID=863921 RepID=UPI00067323E0|nr:hypothetical protein [Gilvimarinus polysaccharolyticus]
MTTPRELKYFPELSELPVAEQQQRLNNAKAIAFGPDNRLQRWRGNTLLFGLMFIGSVGFMALIAPALGLSQDAAAIIMLVVVLPAFFVLQQRRYLRLIRRALQQPEA